MWNPTSFHCTSYGECRLFGFHKYELYRTITIGQLYTFLQRIYRYYHPPKSKKFEAVATDGLGNAHLKTS